MAIQYYLDTSTIYQIRRLPQRILESSFYSSFTLIELVAGLNEETFTKRKAILRLLWDSAASIDETFPEQLMVRAFNSFNEYEIEEKRMENLYSVVDNIFKSESLDEFHRLENGASKEFNFRYFLHLCRYRTMVPPFNVLW